MQNKSLVVLALVAMIAIAAQYNQVEAKPLSRGKLFMKHFGREADLDAYEAYREHIKVSHYSCISSYQAYVKFFFLNVKNELYRRLLNAMSNDGNLDGGDLDGGESLLHKILPEQHQVESDSDSATDDMSAAVSKRRFLKSWRE